jgi:uncharacterized protein
METIKLKPLAQFWGLIILLFSYFGYSNAETLETAKLATPFTLHKAKVKDSTEVEALMQSKQLQQELLLLAEQLAKRELADITDEQRISLNSMLGHHNRVNRLITKQSNPLNFMHFSVHAKAHIEVKHHKALKLDNQIQTILQQELGALSDEQYYKASYVFGWSLPMGIDYMKYLFGHYKELPALSESQALNLIRNYQLYKVYESVLPVSESILMAQQQLRFIVTADALIKTPEGITLSAIIVRQRGQKEPRPSAFQFTIYSNEKWNIQTAIHAAAHGYVGVIADTRGKRLSPDDIVPWEHDGKDATVVIDWISKQPWSDGRVVMYGGSYLGFTQWAAAKYMHPALKAIAPYVAANPVMGLPIENNIFITPNYQWAFHVTNNKTMDQSVYSDWKHWDKAFTELFESGRAFRDIDKVEGTPSPWFQKWLNHPSYDEYYQAMLPYGEDYKKIDIPVLNITGYFDGASITALDFLQRHYQARPNAEHYLIIGPYNHNSAQSTPREFHSNYKLDQVALSHDAQEITFEWFDHLLYGKAKPVLMKDKINYQLMGSNTWQHAPSFELLNQQGITFHLGATQDDNGRLALFTGAPDSNSYVQQEIDLGDRKERRNEHSWQVIQDKLQDPNGLIFVTEPLDQPQELSGAVTGHFSIAINKKDVDLGFKLYEVMQDGKAFQLTRYISRASYAKDMSKRELLIPGLKTQVPIINSRINGKLIKKGSRLALVLNINKNPGAQVNMGTGKDVSDETIADAAEPLKIKWFSDSQIKIPLKPWRETNANLAKYKKAL